MDARQLLSERGVEGALLYALEEIQALKSSLGVISPAPTEGQPTEEKTGGTNG